MENVKLVAEDGYKLSLAVFEANNASGCVQIIHGMEEHKGRYEDFAKYLNAAGYTVILSDMRGHGTDAPTLGFFKERDGYKYLLSDQKRITAYIRERFHVKKVYIFAHSMGTIIARNLLQTQSADYEKVVLSGFPFYPGKITIGTGLLLTSLFTALRGPKYRSRLVQNATTSRFNRSVKDAKTELDWLSMDAQNIRNYQNDPYCGHGFTVSAFHDLFTLDTRMNDPANYKKVQTSLPILMIRGDGDPSTGFDKGAEQSVTTLKKAGFCDIRTIVYPNMRHEILNEAEHETVYADVVKFYQGAE